MNQEIDTFESIGAVRGAGCRPVPRRAASGDDIERRDRGGAVKKKRPKKPKGWKSDAPTTKDRQRHRAWCHYKGLWIPYLEYKAMARNYSTKDP